MLVRLMDMLKTSQISALFTSLSSSFPRERDSSEEAVSSLADNWIKLRNQEFNHTVVRSLHIVKSRGMGYSGGLNDFIITDKGIQMLNPSPD